MTRHAARPVLAALLACLATVPEEARAERGVRPLQMPEQGGPPGSHPAFLTPPWLWVSAGQPLLSSPLWSVFPTALAVLSPGPWGPWPAFDPAGPAGAAAMADFRQGITQAEQVSAASSALNHSASAILNVGASNVR